MSSATETGKARGAGKKPRRTCFRQTKAWRNFPQRELEKISEEDAKELFRKLRWPETNGEPICPHCGSRKHWWLQEQQRWKCGAANCRKFFSLKSHTIFSNSKMSYKDLVVAARVFILGAKGENGIEMSAELGCEYKAAFVLGHKLREALLNSQMDTRLEGDVEVDGAWFGGYIKPENKKINRVDRRLKENQNGKRRVVVGGRERGGKRRIIVGVFDGEDQATAWLSERIDIMSQIYADEAPAWIDLHATHKTERVNHSEEYARGERNQINTNQMESFFSRLRRFEVGTHHSISGPYLLRYAADAAWRETNNELKHKQQTLELLAAALQSPPSRSFSGYWQRGSANHDDVLIEDVFAAFN